LTLIQFCRGQQTNLDEQVAFAMAIQHGNALIPQLQHRTRLRAFGNLESLLAFEGRHLNLGTQGCLSEGNGNHAMQIGPLTLEERMILHVEHDVEIAGGTAVRTSLAKSGETNTSFFLNAGRDLGFYSLLLNNAGFPAATAGTAGGGSLSLSASRSLAGVAELVPAIRNSLLSAEHGFFEFDG